MWEGKNPSVILHELFPKVTQMTVCSSALTFVEEKYIFLI